MKDTHVGRWTWLMMWETWLSSVVPVFTERLIYGFTLKNLTYGVNRHYVVDMTCKDITGLTVTSFGGGRKETAEAIRTDLYVELKCWYVGTIVTFTTLAGEAWNKLADKLAMTDLQTLRQTLTKRVVSTATLLPSSKSHHFTIR